MDKQKLISEVFLRTPLWDKTDENHHNSMILQKLWKEVATECESTDGAVKTQWKKLRETFSKKLATKRQKRSGDPGGTVKPIWPYFEALSFLTDQFTQRETSGNFSAEVITEEDNSPAVEDNIDEAVEMSTDDPLSSCASTSHSISYTRKRRTPTHDAIAEKMLIAEQEKVLYLKRKEEARSKREIDEDTSFFNSILPHVKEFNNRQKLKFRIQVLQLIDTIASENTPNLPTVSHNTQSPQPYAEPPVAPYQQFTSIHYPEEDQPFTSTEYEHTKSQ